jgi:hypothetical protein
MSRPYLTSSIEQLGLDEASIGPAGGADEYLAHNRGEAIIAPTAMKRSSAKPAKKLLHAYSSRPR